MSAVTGRIEGLWKQLEIAESLHYKAEAGQIEKILKHEYEAQMMTNYTIRITTGGDGGNVYWCEGAEPEVEEDGSLILKLDHGSTVAADGRCLEVLEVHTALPVRIERAHRDETTSGGGGRG